MLFYDEIWSYRLIAADNLRSDIKHCTKHTSPPNEFFLFLCIAHLGKCKLLCVVYFTDEIWSYRLIRADNFGSDKLYMLGNKQFTLADCIFFLFSRVAV